MEFPQKKKKKKKIPYKKIVKDVLKIFLEVDSILCPNLFDYSSLSFLILWFCLGASSPSFLFNFYLGLANICLV